LIDPEFRDWKNLHSEEYSWLEAYPHAVEELPPDMPEPKGKPARITCYVDADHAHDKVTRRSVTGILLFVNGMPIKWVSKRQKMVESSTYGSEMVAARIASELILEVRYKLRMMGVPIDGPALLLGDNLSVILSTTVPSATLKKKHQAICYHRIRECIAAKVLRFVHINTKTNLADVLTKPLVNDNFLRLVKPVLFRLPQQWFAQQKEPCNTSKITMSCTKSLANAVTDSGTLPSMSLPTKAVASWLNSKTASDAHSHQAA